MYGASQRRRLTRGKIESAPWHESENLVPLGWNCHDASAREMLLDGLGTA